VTGFGSEQLAAIANQGLDLESGAGHRYQIPQHPGQERFSRGGEEGREALQVVRVKPSERAHTVPPHRVRRPPDTHDGGRPPEGWMGSLKLHSLMHGGHPTFVGGEHGQARGSEDGIGDRETKPDEVRRVPQRFGGGSRTALEYRHLSSSDRFLPSWDASQD
jgi:hypothetical protein